MKTVNWAILAPGKIANKMAEAMKKSNGKIKLYAVGSRDLDKAKQFAEKWGFEKAYGNYKELLADPKVDAVYIANPHSFHFESVMDCLEFGKHVLCEKPAACNLDQLNKMIEKAKEKKLFFMEAMWTAFNPCINRIKKIISEGKIGEIKHIESDFSGRAPFEVKSRLWAPELAGGALLDIGIYNIFYSMMINNFEKIVDHSSSARMVNGVDAWNSVNLIFKNGVTAHFQSSIDIPSITNTHDSIIYGSKGFITSTNFNRQEKAVVHIYNDEANANSDIIEEINAPFDVNGFEYQLIEATECILNGKIESEVHPFQHSIDLCQMMDTLRKDWGFKYPFEN